MTVTPPGTSRSPRPDCRNRPSSPVSPLSPSTSSACPGRCESTRSTLSTDTARSPSPNSVGAALSAVSSHVRAPSETKWPARTATRRLASVAGLGPAAQRRDGVPGTRVRDRTDRKAKASQAVDAADNAVRLVDPVQRLVALDPEGKRCVLGGEGRGGQQQQHGGTSDHSHRLHGIEAHVVSLRRFRSAGMDHPALTLGNIREAM